VPSMAAALEQENLLERQLAAPAPPLA